MSTSSQEPNRVVDRDNHGWYRASDGRGSSVYCIDCQTEIPDYPTLVATRGPVRPVLPVTPADAAELERLLWLAGRKAVTSLAAAIETVFYNLRSAPDGLDDRTCYDYAMRTLKAGCADSWEAALLEEVVFFGDLNLDYKAPERNPTAAPMRAPAPSRRVHPGARDQMAAIISRWVTNPARYTEVAATLADIVSYHADQYAADGWSVIADQWLQSPAAIGNSGYKSACYRLFYSRSEHFNPDWG